MRKTSYVAEFLDGPLKGDRQMVDRTVRHSNQLRFAMKPYRITPLLDEGIELDLYYYVGVYETVAHRVGRTDALGFTQVTIEMQFAGVDGPLPKKAVNPALVKDGNTVFSIQVEDFEIIVQRREL